MKIWTTTDWHIGKYTNRGEKWLNMMEEYFFDIFIPFIKRHAKKDDILVICGDITDNRIALDMRAIDLIVRIFEELSQHIECHVLSGNHDQRLMKDPDINSVSIIRNIPNVYTYIYKSSLELNGKKIGFMPWTNDKAEEQKILKSFNGFDYVFCHSDLNGCRTQMYPTRPKNKELLDIEDFKGIGRVFSGHIHIRQTIENFTFIGTPYQLDRNDLGNTKGFYVIDLDSEEELFVENTHSPEFVKIVIKKEKDLEKLEKELNSEKINYVDVEISKTLLVNNPHIKLKIDKLSNKTRIKKIDQIEDLVKEDKVQEKRSIKNKTIKDISIEWSEELKLSDEVDFFTDIEFKKNMKDVIEKCFNILHQTQE